jgi:hypothetical protein
MRHHRQETRAADTIVIFVENHIGAAALLAQLDPHSLDWKYSFARWACRITACDRPKRNLLFILRLKNLEPHIRMVPFRALNPVSHRTKLACLLTEPKRTRKRNFRAAVWRFATHRSRPQVRNGRRTIRVGRIVLSEFLFGVLLYLTADPAKLFGQLRAVPRNVIKHHLEDQTGNGIQIAGERLAPDP